MRKSWLKDFNPFHFQNPVLLVGVCGNVVLAALLLVAVGWAVLSGIPKDSALLSHPVLTVDRLNQVDAAKLRNLVMVQDGYLRGMLSNLIDSQHGLAVLFCGLSLILLLNSFCMYQAYLVLKRSTAALEQKL